MNRCCLCGTWRRQLTSVHGQCLPKRAAACARRAAARVPLDAWLRRRFTLAAPGGLS